MKKIIEKPIMTKYVEVTCDDCKKVEYRIYDEEEEKIEIDKNDHPIPKSPYTCYGCNKDYCQDCREKDKGLFLYDGEMEIGYYICSKCIKEAKINQSEHDRLHNKDSNLCSEISNIREIQQSLFHNSFDKIYKYRDSKRRKK